MKAKTIRNSIIGSTVAVPASPTVDSLCTSDFKHKHDYQNPSREEDALDDDTLVDGSDGYASDLEAEAERAAVACFGSDAHAVLDEVPRRSTLVAENSAIDVSWFASRGLMSRRSFELYREEMKSKVLRAASEGLESSGKGERKSAPSLRKRRPITSRRASVSMGDLRNQPWPALSRGATNGGRAVNDGRESPRRQCKDAGHLIKQDAPSLIKSKSVDKLVKSIISAVSGDRQEINENTPHVTSKNTHHRLKKNETKDLSSDDIKTLKKMVRRLSQGGDVNPEPGMAGSAVQDQIAVSRTSSSLQQQDQDDDGGFMKNSEIAPTFVLFFVTFLVSLETALLIKYISAW